MFTICAVTDSTARRWLSSSLPSMPSAFASSCSRISSARARSEAARAEAIVAAEAEKFHEWQASLDVVPAIASLRARAEEIREAELLKAEGLLGRLDDGERRAVESITAQIVNKLLHLPTVRMKQAAVSADGVIYADAVRHLFGLGEEDER